MDKIHIHKPPFGPLFVFVLIAILSSIAYYNSLAVPWHFDDKTNIVDNPWIQINELTPEELAGSVQGQLSGVLRQSSYLGFAINYYFAREIYGHGLNPEPWHIVNIILHILTAYLIFLLSFDLLKRTRDNWEESTRFWLAFCTALVFALNPVQTQTVTYVVQRLAGAGAFWYLLTLYLYIKHRSSEKKPIPFLGNFPLLVWIGFFSYAVFYIWRYLLSYSKDLYLWRHNVSHTRIFRSLGSYLNIHGHGENIDAVILILFVLVVSISILILLNKKGLFKRQDGDIYLLLAIPAGLIALTTKENTITLPFFCWFYDYLFISSNDQSFKNRSITGWAIVVGFLALVSPVLWEKILDTYETRDFTIWERVLTQFRVVWNYLFLLIYPHPGRLNLDYDILKSTSLFSPVTTLLAIIAWFGAVVGSILNLKKDKLVAFLILWYFGQLLIESSFIGLELVYEHRIYLPSWGPILLILYGVFALFMHLTKDMKLSAPSTVFSSVVTVFVLVILSVSMMWTIERNDVWADEIGFWRDVISKSPNKVRPKVNLGFLLEQLAEQNMNNPVGIKNRDDADRMQAQTMAILAEAEGLYREAIEIDDKSVYALVNLGHHYLLTQDYPRALEIFHKAQLIKPDDAILQFNLGVTYKELGQVEKAREHYEKAIEIRDSYYEAINNLGILEVEDKNVMRAIELFTEATKISRFPDLAFYNLGNAYVKIDDLK
ncbi:tetratricopeptide repeat protein, partial [bacterium]|nr:tetratricopeptide repeat protein [bacterium]MBU1024391.1 tetratricopeptide repeat protein [bacterium]